MILEQNLSMNQGDFGSNCILYFHEIINDDRDVTER
jgi:hypothetical protein